MNKEPVLVVLNGLAGVVVLVLVALNVNEATHLKPEAITAIGAAVFGACNLVALAIRASVTPVAVAEDRVAEARAELPPGAQMLALNPGPSTVVVTATPAPVVVADDTGAAVVPV